MHTVALLRARLRLTAALTDERFRQMMTALDSNRFADREAAAKELVRHGEQAEPRLRRVLADRPPLEVFRRVETILATL